MSIFAIGDLHLSFAQNKPMDIFGANWIKHEEKLLANWLATVSDEDTVLLTGDHSWALKLDEAKPDLEFIGQLPGTKILIKGNHDLWWQSITKLKQVLPTRTLPLQNNHYYIEDTFICGTRGWVCPDDENFTSHDFKIYQRELLRLEHSLSSATKQANAYGDIIVMLHYPPFNSRREPSSFVELMQKYEVKTCVYGHLHGETQRYAVTGTVQGITYYLVACDYTNFTPVLIK